MPPTSIMLWEELFRLAQAARSKFGLEFKKLEPLVDKRARFFGDLTCDNIIRLRLHRLGCRSRPLARSTQLDTLAEELAHVRWRGHGREHRELKRQILQFWGNGR